LSEVVQAGAQVPDDRSLIAKLFSGQWRYGVADVIATYSRTGHLLLDVRYPAGGTIYCHRDYEGEGWAD
jgi:hypothetical protein